MMARRQPVSWIMSWLTIATMAASAMPIEAQTIEGREPAAVSAHAERSADAGGSADAEAFRLGALRARERYRTPTQATLDGYRSVGPDFPGMGVHWLHISTLISGELDPDRPALLCFIEIDGTPTLVNVAYGMALLPGQEPPPVAGLPPDPWHEHHGTVEEEMILPHGHAGSDPGGGVERAAGVVMFHVWTTPNPEGSFAQHNWALPFLRAGLAVPDEPSEFAARFVGLGTETGLRYQLEIVEFLFPDDVVDEARSEVHDAAEAAAHWIGTVRGREAADSVELSTLDESWRVLGTRLVDLAPDRRVASTVARLHGV